VRRSLDAQVGSQAPAAAPRTGRGRRPPRRSGRSGAPACIGPSFSDTPSRRRLEVSVRGKTPPPGRRHPARYRRGGAPRPRARFRGPSRRHPALRSPGRAGTLTDRAATRSGTELGDSAPASPRSRAPQRNAVFRGDNHLRPRGATCSWHPGHMHCPRESRSFDPTLRSPGPGRWSKTLTRFAQLEPSLGEGGWGGRCRLCSDSQP
jgi:hypothetical protein